MTTAHIPLEIVTAITDNLAQYQLKPSQEDVEDFDDQRRSNLEALRACAQVSHMFAHIVQPHLFAILQFSSDIDLDDCGKSRRTERRSGLAHLLEEKPHVATAVRGISIDLVRRDGYATVFQPGLACDDALFDVIPRLRNIHVVQARGGSLDGVIDDICSFLRLHVLPLNFTQISTLIMKDICFDYATLALFPSLSDLSLTKVHLSTDPEVNLEELPRGVHLRINHLEVSRSQGDIFDVIADNRLWTGPEHYPLMDFSAVHSVTLGDHIMPEQQRDRYLNAVARLLADCSRSIEDFAFLNPDLSNDYFDNLYPTWSIGAIPTVFTLMPRLRNLTLKARRINTATGNGHNALRDVITMLNSIPKVNSISSITLLIDTSSVEEFSFDMLAPYANWPRLVAAIDHVSNGKSLPSLRFDIAWKYDIDHTTIDVVRIGARLKAEVDEGLSKNVYDMLQYRPSKTYFLLRWTAVAFA